MKLIGIFTRLALVFLLAYMAMMLTLGFFVSRYFQAAAASPRAITDTLVEIPYGSSLRRVSAMLYDAHVIDDPAKFYWYLRLGRDDGNKIQAGFYNFSGEVTNQQIADRLLFGTDQSFKITFKEGETLVDLANILEHAKLASKAEFEAAMTSDEIIHLINVPNVSSRKNLENDVGGIEGYLFPDTYFFAKKDTALGIIKKMYARLLKVLDEETRLRGVALNGSVHQLLTLASIVEKETGDQKERPIIASVYQNRLNIGMRLQADPTVIYGIKNYDGKIRKIDLLTYHPYNTYKISGLPPGPIAAPGLMAIRAALNPDNTKYLYFVSKNDGSHIFCENLACHNQAVRKWQIDYFKNASAH